MFYLDPLGPGLFGDILEKRLKRSSSSDHKWHPPVGTSSRRETDPKTCSVKVGKVNINLQFPIPFLHHHGVS